MRDTCGDKILIHCLVTWEFYLSHRRKIHTWSSLDTGHKKWVLNKEIKTSCFYPSLLVVMLWSAQGPTNFWSTKLTSKMIIRKRFLEMIQRLIKKNLCWNTPLLWRTAASFLACFSLLKIFQRLHQVGWHPVVL